MHRHPRVRNLTARLGLLLVMSLASCGPFVTDPEFNLLTARARWGLREPAAYMYTISRSCECLPGHSGVVVVAVRDGAVESRRDAWWGDPVSADFAELFLTIEQLFAEVDRLIRDGFRPIVSYDPVYGYPTELRVGGPLTDWPVYRVGDFQVRETW